MNRYLRLVGAILILTPFINFIVSVAMLPPVPNKWTWAYMSALFFAASPLQWALRASKIVIGYLMLRAKSSAWLPVLVILVVTIAYNFLTFSRDFRTNNFQAVSSILINFVLFGLVLNAEIKSQKELNAKLAAARAAKAPGISKLQPQFESITSEPPLIADASPREDNVVPLITPPPKRPWRRPLKLRWNFRLRRVRKSTSKGLDSLPKSFIAKMMSYGSVAHIPPHSGSPPVQSFSKVVKMAPVYAFTTSAMTAPIL